MHHHIHFFFLFKGLLALKNCCVYVCVHAHRHTMPKHTCGGSDDDFGSQFSPSGDSGDQSSATEPTHSPRSSVTVSQKVLCIVYFREHFVTHANPIWLFLFLLLTQGLIMQPRLPGTHYVVSASAFGALGFRACTAMFGSGWFPFPGSTMAEA